MRARRVPRLRSAVRLGAGLLLAVCFVSCATRTTLGPKPPFAGVNGPLIIAHRGGSLEAPENTLAAIRHAVAAGSDWQEIDVTLSADDQVVVIHDDTVDRTTDGHGPVGDKPLSELKRLCAGRPTWSPAGLERLAALGVQPQVFAERYSAERIPLLSEVLAIPGAHLMIELKRIHSDRADRLVRGVIDAVRAARAWERVAIGSFEPALLWKAFDGEPSIPLVGIAESSERVTTMLELPLQVLAVRIDHAKDALAVAPAGVAVWAWTLYSTAMAAAAVEQGVHGLITDVPQAVVGHLRAPPDLVVRP